MKPGVITPKSSDDSPDGEDNVKYEHYRCRVRKAVTAAKFSAEGADLASFADHPFVTLISVVKSSPLFPSIPMSEERRK